MTTPTMSKAELAAIVAELDADLKKSEVEVAAALKKAVDAPPEKDDSSSPADESASADSSPAPDASAPAAPPAGGPPDASAGGPPAPDASAAPGAAPGGDPAAQQPGLTPEALQAEYSQLSPEELDMHLQAAMAAKEALAASAGPAAGAPPMAPPGAPPAAAPAPMGPPDASAGAPPMPPMGKTGKDMNINSEANGGKISKSEVDSLKEDIENLTKAVKIVLETPIRKSVTSIADAGVPFQKTEIKSMGRRDVDNFIKDNAAKMTKSERDLWLDFVDNKVKAEKLAPMLERLSSK